jgi:hypothetical protein
LFDDDASPSVATDPNVSQPLVASGATQNGNVVGSALDEDDSGGSDRSAALWDALSPDTWPEVFETLRFTGILHNIALNLELSELTDDQLRFSIAAGDAMLLNERHPAQLGQALSQQLGQPLAAHIVVAPHQGRTPASRRAALAAERLADAEQAISSDRALHALMKAFDGQIIPGTIRPSLADGDDVDGAVSGEEHL